MAHPTTKLQRIGQLVKSRLSGPSSLKRLDIISNNEKKTSASIINGTVRLQYWESILQDSVRASVIFTDAGSALPRKNAKFKSQSKGKVGVVEGLPVVGQEKVELKFEDNAGNVLYFDKDTSLYVNKITPLPAQSETTSRSYAIDLASKEFIDNEEGWSRVRFAYSGQVSDHVKNILEDNLRTKKRLDIEETKETLDFIGNNKKPFYVLNSLAPRSVSSKIKDEGNTAGYFFWETHFGFHFKSIDTLLGQEQKKSIIYNDDASENPPRGYDIKALQMEVDNKINVQNKLQMGAYSTRSFLLDPFTGNWESVTRDALGEEGKQKVKDEKIKTAGKELPQFNKAFDVEEADTKFTRTTWNLVSTGQRNFGPISDQLTMSKDLNFDYGKVFNQAIMRYNQLYASQIVITIPGDFSLHAGDTVFIDIPEMGETESKASADQVNVENSGKYLISDLCHHVTADETFTKLVLIRDSFGRVGNPTKNSAILE